MTLFRDSTSRTLAWVMAGYSLLMLVFLTGWFSAIKNPLIWIFFHLAVIAYFAIDKPGWYNKSKWWSPLLIIPLCFTELHYLVHTVHPIDYDAELIAIDYRIFGVHPTVWLERFTWPWLTELLQVVYSTFYFLPIGLAVILLKNGEDEKFRFLIFQITYGFFLSYIGYFMVPAVGPRFTLDHLQTFPLEGLWLTAAIRDTLNALENIQRDAFPSGHTAMTLLVLYYAGRYHKKYFLFMLPVSILMVYSTVYLRYHYVIDIVAGVVLLGLIIWSGDRLYGWIKKRE